jgi:hypothetical protein
MTYFDNPTEINPQGIATPSRSDGVAMDNSGNQVTTSTLLAANGVWQSAWIDLSGYKTIYAAMKSDKPSATGGIKVEFSGDGVNVVHTSNRSYDTPNQLFRNPYGVLTRYVRYTYTNGNQAQGLFWFQLYLSNTDIQSSNYDLNQSLTASSLVSSVRSVLEIPDNVDLYDKITRTGNSLNVNVTNPASATIKLDNDSLAALENITVKVDQQSLDALENITVMGTVGINNFPATQTISGSVSVSNFPDNQAVSAASLPLPTGAATETTLSALNTKIPTIGQKTGANSLPVVIASDQTVNTNTVRATANSQSNFTASSTSATVLAVNTNRKGATFYSEGSIYLLLGSVASTTNYTVRLYPGSYYELPYNYTGIITAVGSGVLRVGEQT